MSIMGSEINCELGKLKEENRCIEAKDLQMPLIDLSDPVLLSASIASRKEAGQREFFVLDPDLPLPEGGLVYHNKEEREVLLDQYTLQKNLPVISYRFDDGLEILVEKSYDEELSRLRDLRLSAASVSQSAQPELAADQSNDLVLPEQIAKILSYLPDSGHIKEIVLSKSQELDGIKPADGAPKLEASADANTESGVIRFFGKDHSPLQTILNVQHEYFHLLEKEPQFDLYKKALGLEADAWNYRPYAQENEHENFAVHGGEVFLNPDLKELTLMIDKAPARTLALALVLEAVLSKSNDGDNPYCKAIAARLSYAETLGTAVFANKLKESLKKGDNGLLAGQLDFLADLAEKGKKPELAKSIVLSSGIDGYLEKIQESKLNRKSRELVRVIEEKLGKIRAGGR